MLRRFGNIVSSQNQSGAPGTLPGAFSSSSFQVDSFSPLQDSAPQQQREVHEAMRSLMPGIFGGLIGAVASERNGHAFATAGSGSVQFQRHPEDRSAEIAANVSLSGTDSAVTGSKFANGALSTGFWFAAGFIPGVDLTRALLDSDATKVDLTLGVIAVVPGGGKLASLGAKGLKAIAGFGKRLFRRKSSATEAARGISNPVSSTVARVVTDNPITRASGTLGRPDASDVFVTAPRDIRGLNASQIAERLTIPQSPTGFRIIEFRTPSGIASPVNRADPGFIGRGRTAGGAREFVVPNSAIPPDARTRIVR